MNYAPCPTCKEWRWDDKPHKCVPTWDWRYFWSENEADEWVVGEVHAHDAEGAALKAAEAYDADDYSLSRGNEVTIEVRRSGTDEVTRWTANAETEPTYYVREREAPQ